MDATQSTPLEQLLPVLQRLRDSHAANLPGYRQRMDDLARLASVLKARRDEIVRAIAADFGRRSRLETLGADVMTVLEDIKHTRRHLRRWMRPRKRRVNTTFWPARAELRTVPLGVVGIVAPWNYPLNLALIPLVNAIAAGNHVMLKPSEHAPRTALLLAELLAAAFPVDATHGERVAVVRGGAEFGAAFTALPLDHLLFTGSTAVGRHVMAAAAANLTPVTLELGGKSPALIAPGHPVEHAAERIAAGKFFNAGQTCVAPDYVLVQRADRDAFVRALMASLKRRYPTLAENPDYTAIVNPQQATRLREWLEDARVRGCAVLQHRPDHDTPPPPGVEVIPPTVILEPDDGTCVMREEIFGPLLPVKSYDRIEDALAFIRARPRPLAFYPFDRDNARLERTLAAVVAGSVCVNDTLWQFGQSGLPIGGVGASGLGLYHGYEGFLTFSKQMPVMRQARLNGAFLFDPPYGRVANALVNFLTR